MMAAATLAEKELLYKHLPDNDELYEGLQCIMRKLKVALEQGYPYTYQFYQQQRSQAGPNKAKQSEQASDADMRFVYQRQLENVQLKQKQAKIKRETEKDSSRFAELDAELEIFSTTVSELKSKIAAHTSSDEKQDDIKSGLEDPTWWKDLRRDCDLILNTNEVEFEKGAQEDNADDDDEQGDEDGEDDYEEDDDGGVDEEVLSLDDDRKRVRRRQSVARHQSRLKGLKQQVSIILQEITDRAKLGEEIAALKSQAN